MKPSQHKKEIYLKYKSGKYKLNDLAKLYCCTRTRIFEIIEKEKLKEQKNRIIKLAMEIINSQIWQERDKRAEEIIEILKEEK